MVDRDGLENRCACKRTVGSNPTLSASSAGSKSSPAIEVPQGGAVGLHQSHRALTAICEHPALSVSLRAFLSAAVDRDQKVRSSEEAIVSMG